MVTDLAHMTPDEKRQNRRMVARRFLIGGGIASVVGNLADTLLSGAAIVGAGTEAWRAALSIVISIAVSVAVPLVFIAFVDYIIKLEGVEVRSLGWHRIAIVLTLILAAVTFTVSFTKLWNLLLQLPGESHYWWLTIALAALPDITMTIATLFMHTLSEAPKRRVKVKTDVKQRRGAVWVVKDFLVAKPEDAPQQPTPMPQQVASPQVKADAPPLVPQRDAPMPDASPRRNASPDAAPTPQDAPMPDATPHREAAQRIAATGAVPKDVDEIASVLALHHAKVSGRKIYDKIGTDPRMVTRIVKAHRELEAAGTNELADLERRLTSVG